jgi:hypothetical protein
VLLLVVAACVWEAANRDRVVVLMLLYYCLDFVLIMSGLCPDYVFFNRLFLLACHLLFTCFLVNILVGLL